MIFQYKFILKNMQEKTKKQKIFDNLFNMAYEPVIVDKKHNPTNKKCYTTIFNALNNVEQHIMIKINPGIYNQRLEIKKKDLKIQASQITQNSILINQQFPNIVVDLPNKNDKIYLQSLKIANTCQNNNSRYQNINGGYYSLKQQNYMNFKVNTSISCCLYIKNGIAQLDECKISLASSNNTKSTVPCIVVQKNGCLIVNRSQIRGGAGTIGIYSRGGKIIIKQTILRDHGVTGLLYVSDNPEICLTIKNCIFEKCNQSMTLNGPFQALVQNNSISQSGESGIVALNGNKSKIVNNDIKQCKTGIQIKNSFVSILKNTISKNYGCGILIRSSCGLMCKPLIKFNTINENQAGMQIEGSLNNSNIFSNQLNFNNLYGIKIANRACPHIFMNKINKTLGNGIQICNNSTAFVQKNQIQASLKCNLVVQGPNNIENVIFKNKITKARGEGIFCLFCQKFTIKDNQINENFNGIVSLTGVQNIQENQITKNQRNGILLIKNNEVTISNNSIQNNKKSGIFIRGQSVAKIENNTFSKNNIQVVNQNSSEVFEQLQTSNGFQENYQIRVPKNYRCQIF